MCDKDREDVLFGEDSYYQEIIKENQQGFDFEEQRAAWKEGTEFSFTSEFYAIKQIDDSRSGSDSKDAIDVEGTESVE